MPKWSLTGILGLALASGGAGATSVETLDWMSLLPPSIVALEREAVALEARYAKLDHATADIYRRVGHELSVRDRLDSGRATLVDLSGDDLEVLEANPSAEHPEAVAFWAEVERVDSRMRAQDGVVDPAVDGRKVRIPGYVLPLEQADGRVHEFLLVPYVGACIHTPPPPANQMVHVRVPDGFDNEGLYVPVWVEGTLRASGGSYDLYLVDGQRPIDAGYSLDALKVERYEP